MSKWNQDIRRIVYKRLLDEFGPCETWQSRLNPTGNKEDWKKICNDIANGLTNITGKNFLGTNKDPKKQWDGSAVEAQIMWGIQETQNSCVNTGAVTNFVLNRAIALEIGLIPSSAMPTCAEFDFKK
jgi:hypothetical protein